MAWRAPSRSAKAVAGRIGGLFGNAFLGFLLGGVPAVFALFALPVEIRHVTVSTSSVAIAMAEHVGTKGEVSFATAGVLVIGLVNITVSFALALRLALQASDRSAQSTLLAPPGATTHELAMARARLIGIAGTRLAGTSE